MLGGKQMGPFRLDQLVEAGVRPDTYVWCKSMDDWMQAREVADICRYFRQRLSGSLPEQIDNTSQSLPTHPNNSKLYSTPSNSEAFVDNTESDLNVPPRVYLPLAILTTLICFPLTGFIAIYYTVMCRRLWNEAQKGGEDSQSYRKMAHDYSRQAKMWIGISFFLGFFVIAILYRFH